MQYKHGLFFGGAVSMTGHRRIYAGSPYYSLLQIQSSPPTAIDQQVNEIETYIKEIFKNDTDCQTLLRNLATIRIALNSDVRGKDMTEEAAKSIITSLSSAVTAAANHQYKETNVHVKTAAENCKYSKSMRTKWIVKRALGFAALSLFALGLIALVGISHGAIIPMLAWVLTPAGAGLFAGIYAAYDCSSHISTTKTNITKCAGLFTTLKHKDVAEVKEDTTTEGLSV